MYRSSVPRNLTVQQEAMSANETFHIHQRHPLDVYLERPSPRRCTRKDLCTLDKDLQTEADADIRLDRTRPSIRTLPSASLRASRLRPAGLRAGEEE